MRAICVDEFGGPEVLRVREVHAPQLAPGRVLVRVRAVGVNPLDTYIRSGTHAIRPSLPYIPHADVSGVVDDIGAGISLFKPGDRVYAYGVESGGAELAAIPEANVYPLPEAVSFEQGAAIGVPYATAWRALLSRARARRGETILVHGASGGVGIAALQLAAAHGLDAIGTASTTAGRALVLAQGARAAFDHKADDYMSRVRDATQGRGVDVVLEMLAHVNLDRDLDILAPEGRVVVIGSRGRVEIEPRKAMGKDASILGMNLFNVTASDLSEIHAGIVRGLEDGTLKPVVGSIFTFDEASKAHAAVMTAGAAGKVVLVPQA